MQTCGATGLSIATVCFVPLACQLRITCGATSLSIATVCFVPLACQLRVTSAAFAEDAMPDQQVFVLPFCSISFNIAGEKWE
eukprot:1021152-Pelagomonas_calceolata.AAC.1